MSNLVSKLVNIPRPMAIGGLTVGSGGLGYLAFLGFGVRGLQMLGVGVATAALILVVYGLAIKVATRRKAVRFQKQMKAQGGAAPVAISETEKIANLDDMRKKFDEGVDRFRSAGKDIYSLPWYLVVGEPGSGKTEAIRRSSIGFPPGLQDELQGVGGTINMSWWFANQAVLLDTAGRLMFQEVETAGTSEWKEFLGLLRVGRPNCPINGLLLMIPADSLIRDSEDGIRQKATKIAQQLDLIQRTLDIRFPVFVVVTKCDLINGFKEFFQDLTTPRQQYQMFGWSNQNSVDVPFDPEAVDQYLSEVRKRLEARRLTLIQDPVPKEDLSGHRIAEVDTLYAMPHTFERIVPNLKHYLRFGFAASEWSARPAFLRGIYFTSSMREGAALDADLADALGVPLESLPEGRAWERDKAFFLRDLFTRKIFAEWGLVTRSSNVRAQHRRRKLAILTTGFAGVLLLLALTGLGARTLSRTIGKEQVMWEYAAGVASGGEAGHYDWLPIVEKADAPGAWVYRGPRVLRGAGARMTVGRFQRDIHALAQDPIRIPWIFRGFRPFDRTLDSQRREARRALFESGVLAPVVRAAREKMSLETAETWSDAARDALGELVRIEADGIALPYRPDAVPAAHLNLHALFRYVLTDPQDFETYDYQDRDIFDQVMIWCYDQKSGMGTWPPAWLPAEDRLRQGGSIERGLAAFLDHCGAAPEVKALDDQLSTVRETWQRVRAFDQDAEARYRNAEDRFLTVFGERADRLATLRGFVEIEADWNDQYAALRQAMDPLKAQFETIETAFRRVSLFDGDNVRADYGLAVSNALAGVQGRLARLPLPEDRMDSRAAAGRVAGADAEMTVVDDVRNRMREAFARMEGRFRQPDILDQLEAFRAAYGGTSERYGGYVRRFTNYAPIVIPDELRLSKLPWRQLHERLGRMEVAHTHENLEKLCKRIRDVFAAYADSKPGQAVDAVKTIGERATRGLGRIESRNFNRECERMLDSWRGLSGNSIADRDAFLGLPAKDFSRSYLIMAPEDDQDYVSQFWTDLARMAVESIADDVILNSQGIVQDLKRYARFPLDAPRPGVSALSAQEALHVVRELRKLRIWDMTPEPKSLGEGQETGDVDADRQLGRLRALDLGGRLTWIRAARGVFNALPAEEGLRVVCNVSIPSLDEQQKLLDARGLGNMRDVGAHTFWSILDLRQGSRQSTRFRTAQGQTTRVERLTIPGDPFEFRLFRYHSDATPDRTVSFGEPWGCLEILHALPSRQSQDSPGTWHVPLTMPDETGRDRTLWLQFDFEKPIPALSDWPNSGDLM
jgi:hypothetical protein